MAIPADDEFWGAVIADPGPHGLFGAAVYYRGAAAALYALRLEIGDKAFSAGTRSWLHRYNDSTATTEDFEAVYEKASGHDLGAFFDEAADAVEAHSAVGTPDRGQAPSSSIGALRAHGIPPAAPRASHGGTTPPCA